MDPPEFMLAAHSMTDAEYNSWGIGVSYAEWLLKELDYEEFNITRLMPSLAVQTVYAYDPDGFARECVVPRNPNVMGHPFPSNTRAPTIQEHEDLLEVANYSRELYGLGGVAYLGGGDDDDGEEEDSEATSSYQPRKRRYC
ncbi:hypothetical protein SO802_026772 [Lithocarpus litseifolius]|uniref:Uncharacterized protein n=1 Tax=Lithocarpus litseifolius TaxID=425828 RepID=A0AAW2C336_9ROSI